MSSLLVNGIELNLPVDQDASLHDLILYLRNNLNTEQVMISSMKVNGSELTGTEEETLSSTPLTQIKSVEVFTTHPREVAQETLGSLLEYVQELENLSKQTALQSIPADFFDHFTQLIEGISILIDGVGHVKRILAINDVQTVKVLEADLLSTLKDLLESQQKRETVYMTELLEQHLTKNLEQWRTEGIPALMRARDS